MPNTLAYIVLFAWPVVAVLLFKRLPLPRALIWTILGGYLLLPEGTGLNLPVLPTLSKLSIPAFAALLLCMTRMRSLLELVPRAGLTRLLCIIFLLSPFLTVATNGEAVRFGSRTLPGLEIYDAFSLGLSHAVLLIPFLLGQRFLTSEGALRDLLTAIAVAGLAYSLPALFEVRMSPQLHNWIYGFFPHDFGQHKRFGGFRPVVFMTHGLKVALFFAMAVIAAAALWRGFRGDAKVRWAAATGWLALTLLFCRTVAGWAYAALLVPVILLAGRRVQRLALVGISLVVLLYPALRGADLVPTNTLVSAAAVIDESRAGSLQFRFDNEDMLLQRANLQPLFGWGGWGRNRVFDPISGEDLSTTDGAWILTVGQYGWVGYIAEYGLLTWPLLLLGATRAGRAAPFAAIALGLVLCANLIDLLPNSGMSPLTWLLAGGLTGALARTKRTTTRPVPRKSDARRVLNAAQ